MTERHIRARSIDEAVQAKGEFRAGGTDLQERREGVRGPLVDILDLPDLDRIDLHETGATLGALARLADIGKHPRLQQDYPALALPAQTIATPQIRSMSTLGGVLCQRTRCWYYRHPDLGCPKKGDTDICPARDGNPHFGVVFDIGPCVHPHPSSIACALLTYNAEIDVTERGRIPIADLYGDGTDGTRDHLLEPGELITHVHLPGPKPGERASYFRQMSRTWAEWPLIEVVVRLLLDGETVRAARIGIGGVANIPLRLEDAEEFLAGKPATAGNFAAAARLATARANPLPQTEYKVDMMVGSVLQALESAYEDGGGRIPFAV